MRSPVNDPGPIATATAPKSAIREAANSSNSATASANSAAWDRVRREIDATTLPFATIARRAIGELVSIPRTGRTPRADSSSRSALNNARDVIEYDERHQRDQQEQSHLQRDFALTQGERLATHPLEREEQQVTAVE